MATGPLNDEVRKQREYNCTTFWEKFNENEKKMFYKPDKSPLK